MGLGHSQIEKGITDKSVFSRLSVALEMLSGISNGNLSQVKPGLHTEGSGRNDFTLKIH